MISLAGGLPDPTLFPVRQLADLTTRLLREQGREVLQYGLTAGDPGLRGHIVTTTPCADDIDQVVVTTGSQQALHLIAQVLLDAGDTVIVADPEYLGAIQAFSTRDVRFSPMPIDRDGIDVGAIAEALHVGLRPKLVYVVPNFHNPSGAILTGDQQTRLLDLADRYGFVVVFDDPYRDLGAHGRPADEPSSHPMAIQLRSVSKVLAPGLRVGWMIGPRWLTEAVERAKQSADLHTGSLSQALVLEALSADWFPAHLERLSLSTLAKRDTLCDALERVFGSRLEFDTPDGGMFVWARFTDGTDASGLLSDSLERGVAFVPGAAFAVERDLRSHLRLSWATADESTMEEAVVRLAG
jgi:2-aminoadipate transaminase